MRDSYDRDIHYLRVSVTGRCDLACRYCRDGESADSECGPGGPELSFEQIVRVVTAAAERGFNKIRLTGGEPLMRPRLSTLVEMIRDIPGVEFLGMTTNGTRLARHARALKAAGLDGVNVSLDTLNPEAYRAITGGGDITNVLAGLDAAASAGFSPIKVNMVVRPDTAPGEMERMTSFCDSRGFILQRIREYRLDRREDTDHAFERPLRCGDCNRLRLTSDGRLLPCLHGDLEIPVDFSDIAGSIARAVDAKPDAGGRRGTNDLARIGG